MLRDAGATVSVRSNKHTHIIERSSLKCPSPCYHFQSHRLLPNLVFSVAQLMHIIFIRKDEYNIEIKHARKTDGISP